MINLGVWMRLDRIGIQSKNKRRSGETLDNTLCLRGQVKEKSKILTKNVGRGRKTIRNGVQKNAQ